MKTSFPKPGKQQWFLVDANGKVLGRLASRLALVLRGRNKPSYVPHWLDSDHIIVVNAAKVKLTGSKLAQKKYYRHTGWLGHLRTESLKDVMEKNPTKALEVAVERMLPKNPTRQKAMKKLHVYADEVHGHEAQQPVPLSL